MHPLIFAGAALVGLPIILHLIMKQEPKRLTFPAFRFLTQKLKTNQRKLRLRHFLLLALRMLLIALFCLTLYQPTVLSERLNLSGEQPVAVAIVVDTSPSMGYIQNEKTRLDEARKRALELLDELPAKSHVAVIETGEIGGHWVDVGEARKQIEKLDKPRGTSQPVSTAVAEAYRLLSGVEQETESSEPLPKLVAVFTDRAAASWDSGRTDDLRKLLEKVPNPRPAHAIFDVGVEHPTNVAILAADMKPQIIAANQTATIIVTVAATGPPDSPPVEAVVRARLAAGGNERKEISGGTERKGVNVPCGQNRAVTFEFKDLKPGLYQVEFSLESPDKLAFDNTHFLTFKVGESRRILTITDDEKSAVFWQLAHQAKGEFGCIVATPDDVKIAEGSQPKVSVPNPEKPGERKLIDLREFEFVTLLNVNDPGNRSDGNPESLWDKLRPYLEAGGKLVIIPGRDASPAGYAAGGNLVPGTLDKVISTLELMPPPPEQKAPGWNPPREGKNGVAWLLDSGRSSQHPLLEPFQEWRAKGNVDVVKNPRRAWKYWDVKPAAESAVIVRYNDADKEANCRPALIERTVADPKDPKRTKGKSLLLTTRMDVQLQDDEWNDYWEMDNSSWYVVFPWLIARYMAGDSADANFNHLVGQTITAPIPKGGVPKGVKVIIDGPPGVLAATDAIIEVGDRQTELRIGPPRTNQPGNYRLSLGEPNSTWQDGFSLNVPADESTLEKVPVDAIEDLTGKNSVVPVDKTRSLREIMEIVIGSPIDLFPWLLIAVLMLLTLEGLIANRFYRRAK
jgi:hypothetical protein